MISIFNEVKQIASGELDLVDNPLKNSPHTAQMLLKGEWTHPYSREQAAYPIESDYKFWPCVSRIDNAYGDRHLVCSCAPMDEYT
jgi:glycine dehydrogenase